MEGEQIPAHGKVGKTKLNVPPDGLQQGVVMESDSEIEDELIGDVNPLGVGFDRNLIVAWNSVGLRPLA